MEGFIFPHLPLTSPKLYTCIISSSSVELSALIFFDTSSSLSSFSLPSIEEWIPLGAIPTIMLTPDVFGFPHPWPQLCLLHGWLWQGLIVELASVITSYQLVFETPAVQNWISCLQKLQRQSLCLWTVPGRSEARISMLNPICTVIQDLKNATQGESKLGIPTLT